MRVSNVVSHEEGKRLLEKTSNGGHAMRKAKPTEVDKIRFRSHTEARVYVVIKAFLKPDDKLLIHWKAPLLSIAPRISAGKMPKIEVDFSVWRMQYPLDGDGKRAGHWEMWRAIDAKPAGGWRDPSWHRGKLAFEVTYGIELEEMS